MGHLHLHIHVCFFQEVMQSYYLLNLDAFATTMYFASIVKVATIFFGLVILAVVPSICKRIPPVMLIFLSKSILNQYQYNPLDLNIYQQNYFNKPLSKQNTVFMSKSLCNMYY